MLKEKYENCKQFVEEHKKGFLIGTGLVITGTVLIFKKDLKTVKEIALSSLNREERRALFEQKEIWESIERLDKNAPINKFDRIPRKLARIEELNMDIAYIRAEKAKIK